MYTSLLTEFGAVRHSVRHTLLGSVIEIILISCTFIFSKFIMRNLHVIFSSTFEFRENLCKKGHDFLSNVNKITFTHAP